MERLAVYVPNDAARPEVAAQVADIDRGAGIVGRARDYESGADRVTVYLEGRQHVVNIVTYADRCANAAGRLLEDYPTSGMRAVSAEALYLVGWFTPGHGVDPQNAEQLVAVAKWLAMFTTTIGIADGLHDQLRVTGAWTRQVAR